MAIYNTESRKMGAKVETTPGQAEVLTSSDYNVRVREGDISTFEVDYSESSKIMDGTHNHYTVTPGMAHITMDTSIQFAIGEFIATGTSGLPTWESKLPYDVYLKSAGLGVIENTPSDLVTDDGYFEIYPNKSFDCQTITEQLIDVSSCDGGVTTGIAYTLKGGMSTMSIEADTPGKPFMMKFSTQGAVEGVEEITANIPVFDDTNTLNTSSARFLNTDIIITQVNQDGTPMDPPATPIEFCSNTFTFDTGNTLSELTCQADEFGLKQSFITSREPKLTIEPLLEKLSDWDYWEALNSENVYHIEIISYADSAKTIVQLKIDIPRAQLISASGTDDNGIRRLSQEFRALKNLQGADEDEKQKDFTITIGADTINQTS